MARGEILGTWEKLAAVVQNGRFKVGLNRAGLAEHAAVSEEFLIAIESGGRTDDRDGILRVCAALGITVYGLPIPMEDQARERARQWELLQRALSVDPPTGRFLRPRPTAPDGTHVLVVLDFDGVLNRLPELFEPVRPGRQPVRGPDGRKFSVDVDLVVVQALDEQVRRPGVSLAWLTSWGRAIDNVIDEVLGGKYLIGGYVLAERLASRFVAGSWKMDALVSHIDEVGDPAFVWADDNAVRLAMGDRDFANGVIGREPRLLLSTASSFGLTLEDVEAIAALGLST